MRTTIERYDTNESEGCCHEHEVNRNGNTGIELCNFHLPICIRGISFQLAWQIHRKLKLIFRNLGIQRICGPMNCLAVFAQTSHGGIFWYSIFQGVLL